ncbi:hypothetical protein C8034_v004876 [Colletotrichum sidae]|uniref:Uncharacterized protein n=1 Tax=Colletotrichum sidae TaxID=1347389 RepID=A0A4R8T7W7_9PEZI|nr:hypothetical protein C8034_v004876 [Colletotrichum sidae]
MMSMAIQFIILALAVTTIAASPTSRSLTTRQDQCCFRLRREQYQTLDLDSPRIPFDVLGQTKTGQIRVGPGYSQAFLCMDQETGIIRNGQDLPCFLSQEFQCSPRIAENNLFKFEHRGGRAVLTYKGNDDFYEAQCPQYDPRLTAPPCIYSRDVSGAMKRPSLKVTLVPLEPTDTCIVEGVEGE